MRDSAATRDSANFTCIDIKRQLFLEVAPVVCPGYLTTKNTKDTKKKQEIQSPK
jgi:hypothetical protein